MAVFYLWIGVVSKMSFWPWNQPGTVPPVATPTPTPLAAPGPGPVTSTQPGTPSVLTTVPDGGVPLSVATATTQPAEDDLVLGSLADTGKKSPHYRMKVTLMARGAAVQSAFLTDHWQTVNRQSHYRILGGAGDGPADLSAGTLTVDGQPVPLGAAVWALDGRSTTDSSHEIRLVAHVVRGSTPVVDVVKTYRLSKDSYDLAVEYQLVNRSGAKIEASLSGSGVSRLDREGTSGDDREVVFWANDVQRIGWAAVIEKPDKAKMPLTTDPKTPLRWAGMDNRFFAILLHPTDSKQAIQFATRGLGNDPATSPVELTWTAEKLILPADAATVTVGFSNYVGPKSRGEFTENPQYVALHYVKVINYGGCCWGDMCGTSFLAPMLLWLLGKLFVVVRNYGVAIMILVVIVRILLHPLTRKSQVSMSKMSKLQPKIEELKKKYGDDKQELNKAMAEFYRQEGFSPLLGCLPMLLQMPIWVALWGGLNSSIDLRHANFMLWIRDLAAPDALVAFSKAVNIPLIGGMTGPIHSLNLLPLLLMVAMFFQQLLTPKPSGPQAGQQKFMMYFMTIFFGVMFYNMPAGLTLYVMASTAVGAGEQYVIKKHIQQQEEAEARGELPKKKESFLSATRRRRPR